MRKYFAGLLSVFVFFSFITASCAASSRVHTNSPAFGVANTLVAQRAKNENTLLPDYTFLSFYKPNYILPLYFTGSPYNAVYQPASPNNEQLKHAEIKYQVSFKVPLWKNMFNHPSNLMFAYTQLSYWQVYNKRAYIRETDYEPEFFAANTVNYHLFKDWYLNYLNAGYVHQSNGFGNTLERSWNRLYLEAIASNASWMLSLKPWVIISKNGRNEDISTYMGYAKFIAAYKIHQHVLSGEIYNLLESGGKRPTVQLTWSFPLSKYVKGYVQVFSGYGQSMIEYNHHTNSAGIGFALNDWV